MSSSPPHLTFDKTLGALLVGFAVACVLWGVLNTQIIMYFTQFKSDRPMYKLLVRIFFKLGLSFLDHSIQVILIWYADRYCPAWGCSQAAIQDTRHSRPNICRSLGVLLHYNVSDSCCWSHPVRFPDFSLGTLRPHLFYWGERWLGTPQSFLSLSL